MAGNIEDSIRFLERMIEDPNTNLNNINIILGHRDDRIERKLEDNIIIYKVPKVYYEGLRIKLEGERAAKLLREKINRKENGAYIDSGNQDIKKIFKGQERAEAINNYSNVSEPTTKQIVAKKRRAKKRAKKESLKNKPNKSMEFKKQKNKNGKKVRKILAAVGIGLTMLSTVAGASKIINEHNTANAATIEVMDENEVSAEDLLKNKFSSELGIEEKDISFNTTQIDSKTSVVKVKLGDKEVKRIDDHSNIINDTTNSLDGSISKLILETKTGDTRKAIESVKKFDKNKKIILTDDGRIIAETRTENEHDER